MKALKLHPFLFLNILFLMSCGEIGNLINRETKSQSESPNEIKVYFDNGTLKSITRQNENKRRHGLNELFFPSGKIRSKLWYNDGIKDSAVQFYENGNPEMSFSYEAGLKHGYRDKFWENGQLQSRVLYYKDFLTNDLKEFTKTGEPVKHPELQIKAMDLLLDKGEYIIDVSFSRSPGRGTYYLGEINEFGYIDRSAIELDKVDKKGRFVIRGVPGSFIMQKLTFVGKFRTGYGNYFITQKSYNLALDY